VAAAALAAARMVAAEREDPDRLGTLRHAGRLPALAGAAAAACVVGLAVGERDVDAGAVEVHSLVMEMATELGLPGLVLLGLFLGGVAVCGRRALRAEAPLAPGACAVCAAWLLHASIDWDWQMPAVTLPALVLAGGLLAASEPGQGEVSRQRSSVPTTRTPSRAVSFFPSSELRAW